MHSQSATRPSLAHGPTPLFVKRMVPNAILPMRQSLGAAGYDLSSAEPIIDLQPGGRVCVSTGISLAIPEGHYGRVAPRSGLAVKNGLQVGAGVIDSDYRGVVGVLLFNHGTEVVNLPAHSRIAQLIIEKISFPPVKEVEDLDHTERGSGGFGSTDIVDKLLEVPTLPEEEKLMRRRFQLLPMTTKFQG